MTQAMVQWMRRVFFMGALFFSVMSYAAQDATVVVDGAMVYKSADFDSAVIGYFAEGRKVRVSNKKFGPFYKVEFKQGISGFISDVDIKARNDASSDIKSTEPKESVKDKYKKPVILSSLMGPVYASYSYAESISGTSYSTNVTLFGLQYSGSLGVEGLMLDSSLLYSPVPPDYYKKISDIDPKGNLIIADIQMIVPFLNYYKDLSLYFAAGPMITYVTAEIYRGGVKVPLSEARMGLSTTFGIVKRFGNKIALRVEPKYIFEKANYFGAQAALQYQLF